MALLEQDHAFEIADALIAASEADETEVSIECTEDRFVRFGPAGPTQSADREHYRLAVRARFRDGGQGFREARATGGGLDEESAFGALQRAVTLARIAAGDPDAPALEGQGMGDEAVPGTSPSRPTQDHSFREKAAWISEALQRAEAAGLDASGIARSTVASRSLVNQAGRRVHGAISRARFDVTCAAAGADAETIGGSASTQSSQSFVDQVDAAATAQEAVDAALRGSAPEEIQPGAYDVVLAPQAVAALVTFAAGSGFGAREVALGDSFMAGRSGETLFDERIRITDDPAHPAHRGWLFDGVGTRTRPTVLVEAGRVLDPVTDGRWAPALGLSNTGHARVQPSSGGPVPGHLVVEAGDASMEELVQSVGDGLFVRQLHYVNLVKARELLLTGMTRGGLHRIQGGEIGAPVRNLRFTESLVEALGRVVGVGSVLQRCSALAGHEVVAPAIAIRGFRFTSGVDR